MREDQICKQFVNEINNLIALNQLKAKDLRFFHIPNGGLRPKKEAVNFKRMGTLKGVPDYQFIWHSNKGAEFGFLEFKLPKKGYLTPEQKAFKKFCDDCDIPYEVVRSTEEAINFLKQWKVLK